MSRIQIKARFEQMVCKGKKTKLVFTLDPDYRPYTGQLCDMTGLDCLMRVESEQMDMDEMLAEEIEDQLIIDEAIEEANEALDEAEADAEDAAECGEE